MPDLAPWETWPRAETGVVLRRIVIGAAGSSAGVVTFFAVIGQLGLAICCLALGLAICVAAVLYERHRQKTVRATPPIGPDWIDTGERALDPTSHLKVAIYYRVGSGERAYVRAE